MRVPLTALVLLTLPALACSATGAAGSGGAAPGDGAAQDPASAKSADSSEAASWKGVVAPADFEAVSIWPEAYSGELFVLEVQPPGTAVAAGDVIARLDPKTIDDQLRSAELELRSAVVRHQGLVARNAIEAEADQAGLERARAGLDRARRELAAWEEQELAFAARSRELQKRYEDRNIEDQRDELDQIMQMYDADELIDATEDLVVKRNKRNLELTLTGAELSRDRRAYQVEVEEALQRESREEQVRAQELALEHLVRKQDIDRAARDDAERSSAAKLEEQRKRLAELKRDRELLTVKAPRAGVLLHGNVRDYRPGSAAPRHERGSRLTARADAFLVADPASATVVFDVPESKLGQVADGAAAKLSAQALPDTELAGTVRLAAYPTAKGDESRVEASVALDEVPAGLAFGLHAEVKVGGRVDG